MKQIGRQYIKSIIKNEMIHKVHNSVNNSTVEPTIILFSPKNKVV